jgi:hypothetical protein
MSWGKILQPIFVNAGNFVNVLEKELLILFKIEVKKLFYLIQ